MNRDRPFLSFGRETGQCSNGCGGGGGGGGVSRCHDRHLYLFRDERDASLKVVER